LLLTFLVISHSVIYALPYRPEVKIRILSVYRSYGDKFPEYSRVWNMEPEIAPDGKYLLKFYPEPGSSAIPICLLNIDGGGAIKEIEFKTKEDERGKTIKNGLLIVPDFPVPCDIIPVLQSDSDEIYEDRAEAGGRIFVRRYSISYSRIDLQEAREKDWLRTDLPEPPGLNMITVVDDKGREVVRQIWPVDGTWWIYEETSMRKSWRIPLSYKVDQENP